MTAGAASAAAVSFDPDPMSSSGRSPFDFHTLILPIILVLRVSAGGALAIRGEIRMRANVEGNACNDCLAMFFCPCCAAVQETTEIDELERAGLL
ncbi:hypothetical protein BDK51DRAFT_45013 [Blyttiomyces helicus]|uniref:PLAC8 family-domain-containing protein n=1 Tax=Blyttiomyces helicus TaxID=388810 RepID=A0A4P9WGZ2_9FUNG|nr:hypothetical protein BDK51DRAFT_45013 [Blyttiomyces helicus]|eukprot:RKO92079.1 hypothetical protein BDK51DRAFT_45013 [Blyttiomyces helicus]